MITGSVRVAHSSYFINHVTAAHKVTRYGNQITMRADFPKKKIVHNVIVIYQTKKKYLRLELKEKKRKENLSSPRDQVFREKR